MLDQRLGYSTFYFIQAFKALLQMSKCKQWAKVCLGSQSKSGQYKIFAPKLAQIVCGLDWPGRK